MFRSRSFRLAGALMSLVVALSVVTVDEAQARRGGNFGSRGTLTYQQVPPTRTTPQPTTPLERSMTPQSSQQPTGVQPTASSQPRAGAFGGLGGSVARGLFFGGLIGLFLGYGFGGLAGALGLLIQLLVIGGVVMLLLRRFSQPAVASTAGTTGPSRVPFGASGTGPSATSARGAAPQKIGVGAGDLDQFERMLGEVQDAYSNEDYQALRRLSTPEMVSYLSEELAQNASKGLKNTVRDVKLLQGDVAQSWREGQTEYASAAMRYSSVDFTAERATGRVVDGDPDLATVTTEVWTFVRPRGGEWKLSAIQDASGASAESSA